MWMVLGGLCLAWNGNELINILNFSKNHIDADMHEVEENLKWRLMGFYGALKVRNIEDSWSILRQLRKNYDSP